MLQPTSPETINTNNPLLHPQPISSKTGSPPCRSHSPTPPSASSQHTSYEWECADSLCPRGSRDWAFIGDRRSVTKVRVRWNPADIRGTVRREQKVVVVVVAVGRVLPGGSGSDNNKNASGSKADNDYDNDKQLSDAQLQLAARRHGPHMVSYCRERVGTTVRGRRMLGLSGTGA